ncbi:MAG: MetS family NSS transporter small subunit [FCB group bacterium]|nr:MetS family NSS transporter small subunit [FCB group bacterium]
MPVSAWLMLVFGCIVLYGGFFWCLMIARPRKN